MFESFQNGSYGSQLGYNGVILAVLNLHIALMPYTKFRFNPTYGFRGVSLRCNSDQSSIT